MVFPAASNLDSADGACVLDRREGLQTSAIAPRDDAEALAAIQAALSVGVATVASASEALRLIGSALREIKTALLAAAVLKADRPAIQRTITGLQTVIASIAAAATCNGRNLLCMSADARDGGSIAAALALGASGEIVVTSIDIDLTRTCLFDARAGAGTRGGILDRIDPATGVSVASLDITALADAPSDRGRLADLTRQVEAAILAIQAAASTLSLARSRINLQASFIASIADVQACEPADTIELDHASAREKAIRTRTMLAQQSLGIANRNTQMILKLFQGS